MCDEVELKTMNLRRVLSVPHGMNTGNQSAIVAIPAVTEQDSSCGAG